MTYGIIGGDKRFEYLAQRFLGNCFTAALSGSSQGALCRDIDRIVENADCVILPIPLTRDGVLLNASHFPADIPLMPLLDRLKEKRVYAGVVPTDIISEYPNITDYNLSEQFLQKNAYLTAEGLIAEMIKRSDKSLYGAKVLLTGYGRIGKIICRYLSALGCSVTVCTRSELSQNSAESDGFGTISLNKLQLCGFDYAVNTAPSLIYDESILSGAERDIVIFDIASLPGGVDFAAAEKLEISAYILPGLPSVYSPKAAADAIYDTVVQN